MKIVNDTVWKILDPVEAYKLYFADIFELYVLYGDDTEEYIESVESLHYHITEEEDIGIYVGSLIN